MKVGEAEKASTLLEAAQNIVKEKELKRLADKIKHEQETLNKEIKKLY